MGIPTIAAPQWAQSSDGRCGSHPDKLTASAPVLDRYCFTLNFGHASGALDVTTAYTNQFRGEAGPVGIVV
jgi:hypothetical protein